MTYREFFEVLLRPDPSTEGGSGGSSAPYQYQEELATAAWPEMLDIPTGLGKTAAITVAWLYRRLTGDADTPRRLVWCLPMRVLVEQTRANIDTWLERAAPLFQERGLTVPAVYTLMGGENDDAWVERPEQAAILIGTQDMLLSRALMRGYGGGRYRWPMDFALLHNDALWIFDEVQLMGAGLPTSAQLEAFRRRADLPLVVPSRTLWSSATLRPDWLDTVDFRPHLPGCRVLRLSESDLRDPRVVRRRSAPKRLVQARARLSSIRKNDIKSYLDALSEQVLATHSADAPTLVILNRVARAQELYQRLRDGLKRAGRESELLLVHARFRAEQRAALNARLRTLRPHDDVIVVATQAVEAGVDITSRHLFTELAPWSSLVQRFGRCNRGGEYDDAAVHWIDLDIAADGQLAPPYMAEALHAARETLQNLESAASAQLPPVQEAHSAVHVLRRKDLLDLFNTEPDLSGFDVDISPYLRDAGSADVQVFWRDTANGVDGEGRPDRLELCPVPIGSARDHLKALKQRPWVWNALERKWDKITDLSELHPGQVLMLHSDAGGYDTILGFVSGLRGQVTPVSVAAQEKPESMDDDRGAQGDFLALSTHLLDARKAAVALAAELPMAGADAEVVTAAFWHDVGKAHPAFQYALLEHAGPDIDRTLYWAKSPRKGRPKYAVLVDGEPKFRRHFRHELASMLAWLVAGQGAVSGESGAERQVADIDSDLVAYLIAAHHAKVRLILRALPNETKPPDDRLYARGVWAGDVLPAITVDGLNLPALSLRLDVMQMGTGPLGPSWQARTAALLERWGPFRLAWLETMVRLADWRASDVRAAGPLETAVAL